MSSKNNNVASGLTAMLPSDFDPILAFKPVSGLLHANPLHFQLFLYLLTTSYTIYKCSKSNFINVSYGDKLRGITPSIYAIFYCAHAYIHEKTNSNGIYLGLLLILTLFTIIWGIHHNAILYQRNYFNSAHDKEDYRWNMIRMQILLLGKPWQWKLFSILFVNIYYQLILFSIVNCPFYLIYLNNGNINNIDTFYYLTFGWIVFFIYLCIADYQMYCFQRYKKSEAISGKYLRHTNKEEFIVVDGTFNGWKWDFIDTGLWKYSRHPNYFAEIMIWLMVALIAVNTMDSINGEDHVFRLCFVFFGCGNLALFMYLVGLVTDTISNVKYPCYQWYMATTNMLIPWVPRNKTEALSTCKNNSSGDPEEVFIYA